MGRGANHFGDQRGHGWARQGCPLNTSCDQQAALRLDAGMCARLGAYRLTARCGAVQCMRGEGKPASIAAGCCGCKEQKALSRLYERMDGVPSGGFVWLGWTWLFCNPLAFVALTLCLCLFPASILMPHFPGLHRAAALFAACTWLAIQDGRFEQAQPSPVQSSTRDGHEHAGINKRDVLTEQAP
jgi:hypothetical protein